MSGFQIGLAGLALIGALFLASLWAFQTFGIYRFDQNPHAPAAFGLGQVQVVAFTAEDGAPVQAWLARPAPGHPILFSFHGNFAGIGPSMQRLSPLIADGTGIVMLQYRGANGRPGRPSEENFARDARALYDQLDMLAGQTIPQDRRLVHGFSLGSGVAIRLAAERPVAGVVLEAALPRLCLYLQRRYHGFPLCRLMWAERYDSIDSIGAIAAPMLFVHGTKDSDVPPIWGKQLYEAATGPKQFVELPEAEHADLAKHGLMPAIRQFLRNRVD